MLEPLELLLLELQLLPEQVLAVLRHDVCDREQPAHVGTSFEVTKFGFQLLPLKSNGWVSLLGKPLILLCRKLI